MTAFAITEGGCGRAGRDALIVLTSGRRRRGGPSWARRGFGPGGPLADPFFRGGRKAARGDIRAAILALLVEEPMHGYQIIRELAERTGGAWRPSPGSVYPTLQQLVDEGLVQEQELQAGKRVYELTAEGRAEAGSQAAAPWDAVAEDDDGELVELRDLAFQLLAATRQVAHAGTAAQIAAARAVLRDARRSLYRLLADDEAGASGEGEDR